jgi:hypothetical protein
MYDGVKPVEHGFHVWPEDIAVTTDGGGGGGHIDVSTYYYQVTYEWTDGQGNIHRSTPSIPTKIAVSAGSSTNTINVPTLRLTYKITPNKVRIVIYRWSTANPVYYQVSSVASPTFNDPSSDSISVTDTLADASIIGNQILYTTGGVVEDTAAPACTDTALFKSRLMLLDAEDPNVIWYSKQVLSGTPVEMSDLFTLYVAPTLSAQGSTGPSKCISALDDKLIVFKANAIYYITGNGPDNTGANNDFSDPVFITSTVGCSNPQSIVFQPNGLMFQSDKGIWLLGRDLSTQYIGAPVENLTQTATVQSSVNVPGTNQVRFTMSSGITLCYDYYYNQWSTFTNVPAVSSTLYQGLHTYLNTGSYTTGGVTTYYNQIYQETPGAYLDGTNPVLMSFTTGWMNLAGLQGFERFYQMYMLGNTLSPFKLNVGLAYNYNPAIQQTVTVTPETISPAFGLQSGPFGTGVFGGNPPVFKARVFPSTQKVDAFQITVNELFDSSYGTIAGAGLTLSGLNLVVGAKKGWRSTSNPNRSFG